MSECYSRIAKRGVSIRKRKRLTRDTIIEAVADALKPLDYVHAFYEAGAVAFNRVDEWSDIDLYAVVNDDKVKETFVTIERVLKSLSPILQKYDVPQTGWQGVSQAFYKLENTSEYLIVDLAILELGSPDKFLEPEIHGNVVFHFNKNNRIKPSRLDKTAFAKKLHERSQRLQARFDMFNNFVQKEINRGNYLEAIDLYHAITLTMLVEALRTRYTPFHHDFRMRYVHYELSPEMIQKLEKLYFVKDEKDLQEKYRQASTWFAKTMLEIGQKKVEGLVEIP